MSKAFSLFFAVLISLSSVSLAQQTKRSYFGFQAGPNLASLRGEDYLKEFHDPKIGFLGGLTYHVSFSKLFSFRTGIAFERKGTKTTGSLTDASGIDLLDFDSRQHLDYLTVPFLAKLNFGSKRKFFFNAGPYLGYLIKSTVVEQIEGQPESRSENTERNKRFDAGLTAGIGREFPVNEKFVFSVEIRNNLGLYNIFI